jgi:hypothetical protein
LKINPKEQKVRRLKRIDVNFISLVDKGANRKKLVFKREGSGELAFEKPVTIKKLDEDQRLIFCIVYSPEEIDTQGDTASADVIKDAAYNFMRCARTNNIDKQHDFIPDEGFVAESWIVKENDPVFPEEPAGSWAVGIKVENDETWNLIKCGEITGLSLAGLAVTEEIEKQAEITSGYIRNVLRQKCSEIPEEIIEKVSIVNSGSALPLLEESINSRLSELSELCGSILSDQKNLMERVLKLEKEPPLSRQVLREECPEKEIVKIWT